MYLLCKIIFYRGESLLTVETPIQFVLTAGLLKFFLAKVANGFFSD